MRACVCVFVHSFIHATAQLDGQLSGFTFFHSAESSFIKWYYTHIYNILA